jgi:hypothetical protein
LLDEKLFVDLASSENLKAVSPPGKEPARNIAQYISFFSPGNAASPLADGVCNLVSLREPVAKRKFKVSVTIKIQNQWYMFA